MVSRNRLNYGAGQSGEAGGLYDEYDSVIETPSGEQAVFVDKSTHTTNYVTFNVNITGQASPKFASSSAGTNIGYIVESRISERLIEVLSEMEQVLDDPPSFEAALSTFFNVVEDLYEREDQREVYFSDLLSMLRIALSCVECNELTKGGIGAIREAISYLGSEVKAIQLEELRQKFRENGVDILRPFKCNVDIKSVLREMYPDEVST